MAWAASGRSTPRRTPAPVTTDSLASPRSPAVACGRWACSAEAATTPPSSPSTADLTESGCPDPTAARKADDQCACESACCSCRWSLPRWASELLRLRDERAGGLADKNGLGSGGHVVCAV